MVTEIELFEFPDLTLLDFCLRGFMTIVTSVGTTNVNSIEILTVEIGKCTITSVYKPPGQSFRFTPPSNFKSQCNRLILGDFNSYNILWHYAQSDESGNAVEDWADTSNLALIRDA